MTSRVLDRKNSVFVELRHNKQPSIDYLLPAECITHTPLLTPNCIPPPDRFSLFDRASFPHSNNFVHIQPTMNTNSGMNFGQQDYSGSNGAVDGMNYQFQNMGINQTPQPAQNQSSHALLGNRVPLTRTTSLVDAIGQQRSSSPFANASGGPAPQQDMFSQPGVGNNGSGPTKSALFNSWNAAHQGNLSSANSTPSLHAMAALNQPQQGAQQSAFPFQNGGANQPAGAPATAPMLSLIHI